MQTCQPHLRHWQITRTPSLVPATVRARSVDPHRAHSFGGGHLILSILLLGTIQNGMGLANIPGPVQTLVIGLILIASIVVPAGIGAVGAAVSRAKNIAEKYSASSK